MPRKNKRRFFGKSNKNKSAKLDRDAESLTLDKQQQPQQHDSDSDEKCDEQASAKVHEEEGHERKSESIVGTSLVSSDSSPAMGQLESVTLDNISALPREEQQHKATTTITLKVIQFVGELPSETRDNDWETVKHGEGRNNIDASLKINEIENDDNVRDNKSIIDDTGEAITEHSFLHTETDVVSDVPKSDENKESENSDEARCSHQRERSFDDNYRVESPKQICIETNHAQQRTKRHAMLIQEISESSSSEEVKQFLDSEASALEMKTDKLEEENVAPSPRHYRVESPESSDESHNHKLLALNDDVMVHEISESSSSESVKNEILASISRQQQQPPQKFDSKLLLKIINIKELPSEESGVPSNSKSSSSTIVTTTAASSKITKPQFECKTEKKLNKAEEAILEALYGNKSLLQIPNLPLDVISEEGSDCGSDVDRQASNKVISDDDDVFLPLTSSSELSKKPPPSYRNRSQRAEAEQPLLINTKIIERESNIPESCKSWEMTAGDSELQAELVYLTSASSSATDLSGRGDMTEDDFEDTSEDTETNSMLENISVPSLDSIDLDAPIEIRISQPSPVYLSDYYQEINEQKLPDILEEDEPQSPRSLDIIASQQQIEDVNKELHHLVTEHEESQKRQSVERVSEEKQKNEQEEAKIEEQSAFENVLETRCDIVSDKKIISDNDKTKDELANRVTPTLFKRKNSSDSSSSSNNSQCTIIRQIAGNDCPLVDPLKDLCWESLKQSGFTLDVGGKSNNKDMNREAKITIQKRNNSASRNAPEIPIMNELELHYECDNDDIEGRGKTHDRVITILQVPPEINYSTASSMSSVNKSIDKKCWFGLQSFQTPNLVVALSPLQKSYVMSSQDSNTSADVLLDMHKKFVERRAYHETYESLAVENSNSCRQTRESQLEPTSQLEDGYFGDRESSVENIISKSSTAKSLSEVHDNLSQSKCSAGNCDNERDENENVFTLASCHENKPTVKSAEGDIKMNSIRNCMLRDEFFKNSFTDANRDVDSSSSNLTESFEGKKFELENELLQLDSERLDLEEELKNLQSLQHFKREEFLFNEQKLRDEIERECLSFENHNSPIKYANDDFSEFIYSNEKLQQELYNEWQDKVLERNERKLQKTIKITSITETIHHDEHSDRAASEILRFLPLENEFMSKLKERQKRLSLPFETELNSSTESLHHQNEESKKTCAPKLETIPAHLHEILKYYEEEIAQVKNSDESGESKNSLPLTMLIGLIGVSMCLCGFYIGKYFITPRSKLF